MNRRTFLGTIQFPAAALAARVAMPRLSWPGLLAAAANGLPKA
jgi:hypothetical protein